METTFAAKLIDPSIARKMTGKESFPLKGPFSASSWKGVCIYIHHILSEATKKLMLGIHYQQHGNYFVKKVDSLSLLDLFACEPLGFRVQLGHLVSGRFTWSWFRGCCRPLHIKLMTPLPLRRKNTHGLTPGHLNFGLGVGHSNGTSFVSIEGRVNFIQPHLVGNPRINCSTRLHLKSRW